MGGSVRGTRRGIWLTVAIVAAAFAMGTSALVAAAGPSRKSPTPVVIHGKAPINHHDLLHHSPLTWGDWGRPEVGLPVWAPNGDMYVSDCGNARIYKVTPPDHLQVFAGRGPGGFPTYYPYKKYAWVTVGNLAGDGEYRTEAVFSCPSALAFDAAGNMFIGDHLNDRIREIDTNGYVSTFAGTGPGFKWAGPWTSGVGPAAGDGLPAVHGIFKAPLGMAFDAAGNLYVADRDHAAIRKIDTNGILSTVAGNGWRGFTGDGKPATATRLYRPVDVTFDAAGNMLISDQNNMRIRMVNHAGIISTVAGSGHHGCGGAGGPATQASMKNPGDIAALSDGSILIVDNECMRIWRVTPGGTMTVYAGNGKDQCGGIGKDVSKLKIDFGVGGVTVGPDGEVYIQVCGKVVRVDSSGKTHLFLHDPPDPRKHH